MIPMLSADGRTVGKRHLVDGLVPVNIDQSGTIRRASTGRTLCRSFQPRRSQTAQSNVPTNPAPGSV
ncbi:hypothetical protein [Aeromonas sp. R2-1]|uniref:hypothetical protein n=1 Tax=Aeromonas sp. R2-1 TaxID=3138459 RepID=UPI0034A27413